jgi:hypothetical protein
MEKTHAHARSNFSLISLATHKGFGKPHRGASTSTQNVQKPSWRLDAGQRGDADQVSFWNPSASTRGQGPMLSLVYMQFRRGWKGPETQAFGWAIACLHLKAQGTAVSKNRKQFPKPKQLGKRIMKYDILVPEHKVSPYPRERQTKGSHKDRFPQISKCDRQGNWSLFL